MNIAVLLWSPDISGGTNVVFEHVKRLKEFGHQVSMITEDPVGESDVSWHTGASALTWKTYDDVQEEVFDLAIATWWRTALYLNRLHAKNYSYFVQSIESFFYPEEEKPLRLLVESTYNLPVWTITEAHWIQEHLKSRYFKMAKVVKNGIRKEIYKTDGAIKAERDATKLRVLVEGPLGVSFKNVEKTIELCKQSDADEVWLLTSSPVDKYPGVDRIYSRVPVEETAEIYRSCDVLVKLSRVEGMFGPPLEMFHCGGTAITYNVTGHEEYMIDTKNSFVLDMEDEAGVVERINMLKDDPELLLALKKEAIKTAEKWPDWHQSALEFEETLKNICVQSRQSISELTPLIEMAWSQYGVAENYRLRVLDLEASIRFRKIRAVLWEKFPKTYTWLASYKRTLLRKLQ